jgi:hypothetical protein
LQDEFGAGFLQDKAEDAGGLTPIKDDDAVMRKACQKAIASF